MNEKLTRIYTTNNTWMKVSETMDQLFTKLTSPGPRFIKVTRVYNNDESEIIFLNSNHIIQITK